MNWIIYRQFLDEQNRPYMVSAEIIIDRNSNEYQEKTIFVKKEHKDVVV